MKRFTDIESLATICAAETLVIFAGMAGIVDAPQKYPMGWANLIVISCLFCVARTIVADDVATRLWPRNQAAQLISIPIFCSAITFINWLAIIDAVGTPSALVAMCFGLITLVVTGQVAWECWKAKP